MGMMDHREHILMIQRQRRAGQFHSGNRRDLVFDAELLQNRDVGIDAVVFGTRSILDVLTEKVDHPPGLAGRVVT